MALIQHINFYNQLTFKTLPFFTFPLLTTFDPRFTVFQDSIKHSIKTLAYMVVSSYENPVPIAILDTNKCSYQQKENVTFCGSIIYSHYSKNNSLFNYKEKTIPNIQQLKVNNRHMLYNNLNNIQWIYNGNSLHGFSGSPVFQNGYLIGLLSCGYTDNRYLFKNLFHVQTWLLFNII